MRTYFRKYTERGYSLIEMLIVLALVGILSLVIVPQFANFAKANKLKTSLRQFNSDVRNLRQLAITQNLRIRITFPTGPRNARQYQSLQSTDRGVTWTPYPTPSRSRKTLDPLVYFSSSTFTDVNADTQPDIILLPNGMINPAGNVVMRADAPIMQNQATITIGPTGRIQSVTSHYP